MITKFIILSIFCLTDSALINRLQPLVPSEDYTHSLIVDEDTPEKYQVLWKLINNDEIQFELHAKTVGWVGLGISPNGGMQGSDIVIGWVKDNKAYLKDCHSNDKVPPIIDEKQDYVLLDGAEIDGYTILKLKRKLLTCDSNDADIKVETQYMIFAWNNEDPITGNGDWKYHGTSQRFIRVTMLLSYKDETLVEQNLLPSNLMTHTMRAKNIKVPPKDTYYMCDLQRLPKFVKPVHWIQYEILINPKNRIHFHHLLLYICEDFIQSEGTYECGSVVLPELISYGCMQKQVLAWGVGGQYNYSFPKEAGYRFTEADSERFVLVEIHYDNPDLKDDIVDDSGIKFYFTEDLRENDLGFLILGIPGNLLDIHIPPKSKNLEVNTICYPECTERYIPDEGVTVVSGLLHTHKAGRSVKTTLIKNNIAVRELFENKKYDFNYQFMIDIEPVKLQKGDALLTTCVYESNDRTNFTRFGFGTMDEMCFDFVYYYPRIPSFMKCMTWDSPRSRTNFYHSLANDELIPDDILLFEESFYYGALPYIHEFFNTKVNSTPEIIQRFEEYFSSKPNQTMFCGDPEEDNIFKDNVLFYTPTGSSILDRVNCTETTTTTTTTTTKNGAIKVSTSIFLSLIYSILVFSIN